MLLFIVLCSICSYLQQSITKWLVIKFHNCLLKMDSSESESAFQTYIIRTPFQMSLNQHRHSTLFQLIEQHNISRLLDLGCSQGQFLRMAARSPRLQCLVGLDIEENALRQAILNTIPEQLQNSIQYDRNADLTVKVFEGNLLQPYKQLKDYSFQMISLIEVIQHLSLQDVPRASQVIFGFIRPRLVVVTTPNKQFNAHFGDKGERLRHWDHKFEWTRAQFQEFCSSVQQQYGYNFQIRGLGEHVSDPSKGCCTQMAIFTLNTDSKRQTIIGTEEKSELKLRVDYLIPYWRSKLDANMKNLLCQKLGYQAEVSFQDLVQLTKEDPLIPCLEKSGIEVNKQYFRNYIKKFPDNFQWDENKYWSKPLQSESEEYQDNLIDESLQRVQTVSEEDLQSFGFEYSV